MKIDYALLVNPQEQFIAWVIAEAIKPEVLQRKDFDPQSIDITLTINGEEADFAKIFKSMSTQLDRMILEKAVNLVSERLGDSESLHQELLGVLTKRIIQRPENT